VRHSVGAAGRPRSPFHRRPKPRAPFFPTAANATHRIGGISPMVGSLPVRGTTTKRGLAAAGDLACTAAVAYAPSYGSDGRLLIPHCTAGCESEGLAPRGADSRQLVGRPATRHSVIPRVVRRISAPILHSESLSGRFSTRRPVVLRGSRDNDAVSVRVPAA
jgi:hypothetical protein